MGASTDEFIITQSMFWPELMRPHRLSADAVHEFKGEAIGSLGAVNYIKLNIFPDGGVSRLPRLRPAGVSLDLSRHRSAGHAPDQVRG